MENDSNTDEDSILVDIITTPTAETQESNAVLETNPPPNNAEDSIEMKQTLGILIAEMQGLRQDFDTKIKYDTSKSQLIDSLHSELQTYREGLHFKILRPLFMDLIAMYDDLGKLIDNMSNTTTNSEQTIQNLDSFQETIELILQRHNVETFSLEEPTFVASKQRIVKVISTQDASQAKQIARRVRKGFSYDDKILRSELVDIYKLEITADEAVR